MENKNELSFRLLDSRTKARVRYERVNDVTGEEVPWDKIVKGYEYSKDNYVLLDDEDFKKAAVEASQTINIESFVDAKAVSYEFLEKPYILVPQKKAEKGYVLLRDALKAKNRIGIARVVIRTREYLAAVTPFENGLMMILMRFAQELRPISEFALPEGTAEDYKISDREAKLADELVDAQTSEWEPAQYEDEYRTKLLDWIEKKVESGGTISLEEGEEGEVQQIDATNVVDLVELLRESVQGTDTKKSDPKKSSRKSKSS